MTISISHFPFLHFINNNPLRWEAGGEAFLPRFTYPHQKKTIKTKSSRTYSESKKSNWLLFFSSAEKCVSRFYLAKYISERREYCFPIPWKSTRMYFCFQLIVILSLLLGISLHLIPNSKMELRMIPTIKLEFYSEITAHSRVHCRTTPAERKLNKK